MPPKKKSNKKGADDWEAELGETISSTPPVEDETKNGGQEAGEDDFPAGGLMAAMKKNRSKKKAKGKPVDDLEDVDGDEAPVVEEPALDLSAKAPEEANMDDEFALPDKKSKGKGAGKKLKAEQVEDGDEEERGADGRVMSKKEKEKAKKEREKQRKKEQVRFIDIDCVEF